jgi:hypothetical protein
MIDAIAAQFSGVPESNLQCPTRITREHASCVDPPHYVLYIRVLSHNLKYLGNDWHEHRW